MGKSSGRKKKGGGALATGAAPTTSTVAPSPAMPRSAPPSAASAVPKGVGIDASVLVKRAHELKEEGNRLFQAKDYVGALRQYELAVKLTPRAHPDRAVFHSNRAACLMQMRPVDHEAVAAECSLALQVQPRFPRALLRRARAFEALKRYDLAMNDVHALLAIEPEHTDALELDRRLCTSLRPDVPSAAAATATVAAVDPGSRPSPAALGASAVRVGAPVAGLGPSLPSRPKKTSPPLTTSTNGKPVSVTPQNASSSALTNGSNQKKPEERKNSLSSDLEVLPIPRSVNSRIDVSRTEQRKGNESLFEVRVTHWRPLKLVYGHDIRLAQMPVGCSFKALREIVANRFSSSKSVLIKYKDADGDLVTVTSSSELRLAESCIDQLNKKDNAVKDNEDKLQVLRLHIVEVSPEQEPQVPEEDDKVLEDDGLIKTDDSLSSPSNGESLADGVDNSDKAISSLETEVSGKEKAADGKKECNHPECKEVEVDDWLLEFAQLFRNQVGIDPDAHLDLHELGMELCSEALEETVTSEEAQGLFEMAAAKFQEVAALAFFNWGNVHMCSARKRIPLDESASKEFLAAQLQTAYDWVHERYALAGKKYDETLLVKPDFYEGLLALGQQQFETAKLQWSFALASKVDLATWDSSETLALFNSAEEKMKAATEIWEKVEEQRILELRDPGMSKKDELLKKRKKQGALNGHGDLTANEAAEQAAVMKSQIHLFWGNMLFERSQLEFKLGFGDWQKNLDAAVDRFKLAGASEGDISAVLKNHASNATESVCEEKKVTDSANDVPETNVKDEDKHVLEN